MFRIIVGIAQIESRSSRSIHPLRKKLVHVRVRFFVDRFRKICGHHVLSAIRFQVVPQSPVKSFLAQLVPQHVQHQSAFPIRVSVELAGIVEIVPHDRLRPKIWLPKPLSCALPSFILGLVPGEIVLAPHRLQEGREPFIEPNISPILAGHQIAKPLVSQFVRNQWILAGHVFRREQRMNQRRTCVRSSAGVLHSTRNELIHHGLRVFFPRIIHAKLFAEQLHHLWRSRITYFQPVASPLRRVIGHRLAPPAILRFIKFAGHHRDQIRRTWQVLLPRPGFQSIARFFHAD